MRIALVVHKFPPFSVGGTEVYSSNVAKELAKRGHRVFVFFRDDGEGDRWIEEQYEREGIGHWRVGRAFREDRVSPLGLFRDTFWNRDVERSFDRFLEWAKPGVVHFQHLMKLSFRLPSMVGRRGIPSLLTFHDYWFLCANAQLVGPGGRVCRGKKGRWNCVRCATARVGGKWIWVVWPGVALLIAWRDGLVRRAALAVRRWIAPSLFLRDRYVAEGWPLDRWIVLENGVDVEKLRALGGSKGGMDRRVHLCYIGALAWQKGVHVVLKAVRGLSPDRLCLRVVGDLDRFPEYGNWLRELADPRVVTFEGPIPNEQIGKVLAHCDAVVVPSLWFENSPVVIQEAFAVGVPVIASSIGALKEKVRHGVDGLCVPPGDVAAWRECLSSLALDPSRLAMLRSGVQPPMGIAEHVDRLEEIYRCVGG